MKFKYTGILILIVFMTFLTAGCGSSGGGGDDGGGSDSGDSATNGGGGSDSGDSATNGGGGTIDSVSVTNGAPATGIVANGASQSLISATVLDTSGNNVADGTTVSFTTTAGDIDSSTVGVQTTYSSATINGVASATLTSPTNVGTANITATAGGVSDTTSVSFIPGAVNSILLTATPNNLTADSSSSSTIRAFVTDVNGNAVANGEIISFSVTSGTGVLSAPMAVTTGGAATVTYTASDTAGTETITAEATNATTKTVDITLITEQVGNIALSLGTASIVADGQNSTIVSATIINVQGNNVLDGTLVTFTTTGGDIDSNTFDNQLSVARSTSNGVASTILRSSTTSGQYVVTTTAGSMSQLASVEFVPGPAADIAGTTLSANPTVIDAGGVSTSLITAGVVDENNNPVTDGTMVNFYTTAGGLSHASSATANGIATVVLTSSTTNETATVTAIVDSVSKTVDVTFGTGTGTGEPVYIIITVDPENIRVKGTGGIESAVLTASVKDENGQPYNDSEDNIEFEILTGPGGGEILDSGDGSPSASEITKTAGGIATVSLNSGTISGTVRVQVTVLKDGGGAVLAPANQIIAISTQIGIETGDPFNITLYKAPEIEDNEDGSMSCIISALVQDQYGNPVADNTGVYFGLVDNEPYGYKSSGNNGVTSGTATFTSAGTNFTGDGVVQFDTLIILKGQDEGGHIIDTSEDETVTLFYSLTDSEINLDFVAGNAELGVICGVVPTGNLDPDTTCTPSGGFSIKGIAHTRLTWGEPAIFEPFYLYAETEGRNLGKSLAMSYP
ncbi:MAG: invasin domain 3-containing protein, partial [Thermodesulfobacteriota bacterium]|nr:invasin domain 3-containing protein [Thermodesulfobacteriota bacterium]